MRRAALLFVTLAVANGGRAATAYVSDELILGVYSQQNQQGERLTTLHSGASVETLAVSGDYTQVRLADGTVGWVKTAYLMERVPASLQVKQLQEELDRSHATTPALAEAAAHTEVERLQHELEVAQSELKARQSELEVARARDPGAPAAARVAAVHGIGGITPGALAGVVLIAAGCGFWLGYATLARRVRQKFGGLRVY
jgi:hypothetical protein